MNWTTILTCALAIMMALGTCALLAITYILAHIAHGEPDVNGDPERDAGIEPPMQRRSGRAFPTPQQHASSEPCVSRSAAIPTH